MQDVAAQQSELEQLANWCEHNAKDEVIAFSVTPFVQKTLRRISALLRQAIPIPVTERLPDDLVKVLALAPTQWDGWEFVFKDGEDEYGVCWLAWEGAFDGGTRVKKITHWLPSPPE